MDLSVVIPAYQEADRLPPTLARIQEYLSQRGLEFEIIVVDDGSTDGTKLLTEAYPGNVHTKLLAHNQGKGAAVRTGVLASKGNRVLLTDADLSSPIEELPKLERALEKAPIAFGSRALDRSLIDRRQPFFREALGRTFNRLLRILGVSGMRDTQCGFKLLEGDVARDLFSRMTIDGFAFDVELLLRAQRQGIPVQEVPVVWNHVEESRVHPIFHSAQMLWDVMKLRWRLER